MAATGVTIYSYTRAQVEQVVGGHGLCGELTYQYDIQVILCVDFFNLHGKLSGCQEVGGI